MCHITYLSQLPGGPHLFWGFKWDCSPGGASKIHQLGRMKRQSRYFFVRNLPGWWFQSLLQIWTSIGMIIPNIWENKKCSKPPTRESTSHLKKKKYGWKNRHGVKPPTSCSEPLGMLVNDPVSTGLCAMEGSSPPVLPSMVRMVAYGGSMGPQGPW